MSDAHFQYMAHSVILKAANDNAQPKTLLLRKLLMISFLLMPLVGWFVLWTR